ncbi:hypothetical protein Pcinc_014845 [Petrolisthes cinctipes]|uniref:Fibronectin type-III domain-containing protein n=1 Tax=Petrolisthes cinctipes TaxID=88211 RepID=A0AAE1KR15_PETCI|nr:hypothetical protein Pcinc_014845 [Petrolisthes cinctipes]
MDTSWDPVTSPGNCNLTYRVSWNHTTNLDPNITTDNYFNITGLSYFTTYEVCVDPWVEGLTTIKKCEISTTVTSVPGGPPENINGVSSTTEALTVEWDPPATPNGVITNYSVTWSPDDPSEPIITTATTFTLTDLKPCTDYTISISAATAKGNGPPGDSSQTTLPKAPGPPTNVTVAMVSNHSDRLDVTWIQPPSRCTITNNTISWSLNSTGDLIHRVTIDANESYAISGLEPWATYLVCVSASTLGGDGPDGHCIKQTTDQDIPFGPPENISARTIMAETMQVDWDPPASPNGFITNYVVTWSSADQGEHMTVINNTTYTMTDLLPCTSYIITVSAATTKGNGPPGLTEGNSSISVPGGPPENIKMVKSTMESVTVEWDPPAIPNSVIIKYTVFITPNDALTQVSGTKYTAIGLQPNTTYNITITADNCMGNGPPGSILGETKPAATTHDGSANAWAIVGVVLCSLLMLGILLVVVVTLVKRTKGRKDDDDDRSDTLVG